MIERALEIPGWMTPAELRWLAGQAAGHRCIVEVGCWRGRSTRALADNTLGVVWAVDDWQGAGWDYDEDLRNVRRQFYRRMRDLIDAGRVAVLELSSEEATHAMRSAPVDMVFLDGNHRYEAVRRDLELWAPLLQPGGLLCGHDYGAHPGVRQAVDEVVGDVVQVPGTSIWRRGVADDDGPAAEALHRHP